MSRLQRAVVGDAFQLRSPSFWRDLALGLFWGIALFWSSMDALRWGTFRQNWWRELIFVAIPLLVAMLSPRRLVVLFVGLCLPLFRFAFLVFVFRSVFSALVVIAWAVLLVVVGALVKTNYEDISVPEGTTGLELLVSISALAIAVLTTWKLHDILHLG
jgi:hypothetical protein